MAHNEFSPAGFALSLGIKDVDLLHRLADDTRAAPARGYGLSQPRGCACGRGDVDWGVLITLIHELAGLEPPDSSPSAEN